MSQEVRGVIARSKGAPVELVTINVPDPGPGEAVVTIQACGVCHTDLHYREGGIGEDYPYLLGHEAAGLVESVGAGVADLAPGDYVILNWRAVCGSCRACRRGRPWYCFATHNAKQKMTLTDGTELSPALGIGAFIDKTLVAAGQCTKVDPTARPAAAGLLGCGVMAGLGAAINTGNVGRGDSVAVIGCGAIGLGVTAGAKFRGGRVIAIDVDDAKLELAKACGADHVINSHRESLHERLLEFTDGLGPRVVVEAVGLAGTYQTAIEEACYAGRVVCLGYAKAPIALDTKLFVLKELDIVGSRNALPADFADVVGMLERGGFPSERIVSHRVGLDGAAAALRQWSDEPATVTKIHVSLDA